MRMIGEMRRLISLLSAVVLVAGTAGDGRLGHGEGPRPRAAPPSKQGAGRKSRRWTIGGGAPCPRRPTAAAANAASGQIRAAWNDPAAAIQLRRPQERSARCDPRNRPIRGQRGDPRYDPRAYGRRRGRAYHAAPRRGGYLGPGAGGDVIQDIGRNRLRPPPRGYEWVRTPNGMALVSQSTRQVFDVVPYPWR